jgi:hypothetical protein
MPFGPKNLRSAPPDAFQPSGMTTSSSADLSSASRSDSSCLMRSSRSSSTSSAACCCRRTALAAASLSWQLAQGLQLSHRFTFLRLSEDLQRPAGQPLLLGADLFPPPSSSAPPLPLPSCSAKAGTTKAAGDVTLPAADSSMAGWRASMTNLWASAPVVMDRMRV